MIFKNRKAPRKEEVLIYDLNETKSRLEAVEGLFSYATDPDMIESATFEIDALNAKYGRLLKEIRALARDKAVGDE